MNKRCRRFELPCLSRHTFSAVSGTLLFRATFDLIDREIFTTYTDNEGGWAVGSHEEPNYLCLHKVIGIE